ncbi:MAG: TonB-dependent receptor [Steroidobacteraceae bacterium]|nr:TonB-dependent receptor [Steroidobacteraceae bacterium]
MNPFGGHTACRAFLAASGLAATSFFTTAVSAQEGAAADETLSEVVVTAQMREQSVQDIPLSITAVTGDLLEARSQTNLKEISAQAPNVLLQQNPAGSGNSMRAFIRGVGQSDQSPSVEPGVGIYIDDIYFGTVTASAFDLVDLDRIEILRGPQGTLSGMNSQGGSIKLYSRKPGTGGDSGRIEATAGSFGRRDFRASADFTIVPDKIFARVTGVSRNRDGHVKLYNYACVNPDDPDVISGAIPGLIRNGDCRTGELGNQQMYAVRGALRIAPTGSPLEINLIGDYTKDTSSTQASVLIASAQSASVGTANPVDRSGISIPYQGVAYDDRFVTYGPYRRPDAKLNDPYASYANFYDPGVTYRAIAPAHPPDQPTPVPGPSNGPYFAANASQVEAWGVSGTIDYQLNDHFALKSITGYRRYETLSGMDNDGSPVVFIQSTDWFEHEQFSQEVRFTGNLVNDTVHFTVGGIYYDASTRPLSRIHTPFSGFGPPGFPTFSFLNDDTADVEVLAGFTNVAWDVTDALTLEGGFRLTDEQKDYTFGRLNPDGNGDYLPLSNPDNPLTGWTGRYADTVDDYRAAASYKLTPDAMVYAQFATGHKAGGISPRPYSYHQIRPFGAEILDSYEIGFKADLFDRRIRLNGSGFHMDYKGYQGIPQVCVGDDGQPLPVDAGGVPGLCGQYLNLADAKVKGFELETLIRPISGLSIDGALSYVDFRFGKPRYATNDVREGSSRPGIGKWKWSVGAQYTFNVGTIGTLTPRVDVTHTPGYCGNFACDPNATVNGYTLTNARLMFDTASGNWSLALEATNLTDKLYYLNKFQNVWYVTGQPGRPRELALTIRREF